MKSRQETSGETEGVNNFDPGAGQHSETGCSLITLPFDYVINYLLGMPKNVV
jgi:hypothetical protein